MNQKEKTFLRGIKQANYMNQYSGIYNSRTYSDTVFLSMNTYTDDYLNIEYTEKILKKSHLIK
jgi:hypothetical protein